MIVAAITLRGFRGNVSKAQWIVVALGILALAAAACWPPYRYVFPSGYVYWEGPTYAPLWAPPPKIQWDPLRPLHADLAGDDIFLTPVLYWRRVAIEWAVIVAVAMVALAALAWRQTFRLADDTHPRGLPHE